MKILVTGSSGQIGHYVVQELVEAGHEVLGVDLRPPEQRISRFLRVDMTAAGEVYQAIADAGAEAVVHMGSWADPGVVPDTRTYGENVQGAFNLFQACADMHVRRVIFASSGQVYGFQKHAPVYLPVDEQHPLRPVNSYALSKTAGEQMADYFVANRGLNILSFRLNGVRAPARLPADLERMRQEPEHAAGQLWMRADARDAALACRLALETASVPSGPYHITGAVAVDISPATLVRRYFGDQIEIRADLSSAAQLISTARAKAAFGYAPRYHGSIHKQYPE